MEKARNERKCGILEMQKKDEQNISLRVKPTGRYFGWYPNKT